MTGAFEQFEATEKWRKDIQIKELYENFDVESYEEARKMVS